MRDNWKQCVYTIANGYSVYTALVAANEAQERTQLEQWVPELEKDATTVAERMMPVAEDTATALEQW